MNGKVPIGPTTIVGGGVTVTGVAAAIIAYATGDRSEQTLGVLTAAAVAALAFFVTAVGRIVQSNKMIQHVLGPQARAAIQPPAASDGVSLERQVNLEATSEPVTDDDLPPELQGDAPGDPKSIPPDQGGAQGPQV